MHWTEDDLKINVTLWWNNALARFHLVVGLLIRQHDLVRLALVNVPVEVDWNWGLVVVRDRPGALRRRVRVLKEQSLQGMLLGVHLTSIH